MSGTEPTRAQRLIDQKIAAFNARGVGPDVLRHALYDTIHYLRQQNADALSGDLKLLVSNNTGGGIATVGEQLEYLEKLAGDLNPGPCSPMEAPPTDAASMTGQQIATLLGAFTSEQLEEVASVLRVLGVSTEPKEKSKGKTKGEAQSVPDATPAPAPVGGDQ